MDIPAVDVAAAGGWKNTATMKLSYQKADPTGYFAPSPYRAKAMQSAVCPQSCARAKMKKSSAQHNR
jgi:hypothetical protein